MKFVTLTLCAAPFVFGQEFEFAFAPPQGPHPDSKPRVNVVVDGQAIAAEARARVAADMHRKMPTDQMYRNGTRHLDRGEWDRAAEAFTWIIERKGERMDGAYYWKAYALGKTGKRDEALGQLAELERNNPKSRWIDDARALTVELKQASGLAVSGDVQNDEELKLIALNGLMDTAPDRAVPAIRDMLRKSSSPRLKERALFVLAQSNAAASRDILAQYARGDGANPDLQLKAVEYLGMNKNNVPMLAEIYNANSDPAIRRRILHAYMGARDKDRIMAAARSEQDLEVRREAINLLGGLKAESELLQLYSQEQNQDLRRRIIHSMRGANSAKGLVEIARKESNPELKREAVQMLAGMKSQEALDYLAELLNK
jgi:tetratricopeptide (TPR) repeat protein